MMSNPLEKDLNTIVHENSSLWENFRNQKIFMTGGTGFFGCWFLESFIWANEKLNLNAELTVLTRSKNNFEKKCPYLAAATCVKFHEGNVQDFIFPDKKFSYVIHAATEASASLNDNHPFLMIDTIIKGTAHTLEFARHADAKKFLFISSGAVYGRQPPNLSHVSEAYPCQPKLDDPRSAYAVGKCTAEHLCTLYSKQYGLDIKIARCFAFVGPYLPLDIHFAIGNFIRDGLKGGPINVNGDGSPYRSYLYAADLMIWLMTILMRGETLRPYNVGSDEALSISEIAHHVADTFSPKMTVQIAREKNPAILPERYIPDIKRAREELGLKPFTSLREAIQLTKQWNFVQR